jgi:hypothetical protein
VGPVVVAVVPACVPVPGDVPSVGLPSVLPVDGRLDVDDDPDEGGVAVLVLPDADADAVALGPAFFEGLELAVEPWQGESAGLAAFLLRVGLVFALAEAVAVAVLLALLLAVAVAVLVAVAVADALSLPDGLMLGLPLAGVPLAPSLGLLLAGEACEPSGDALGFAGFVGLAVAAGEDDDGQAVGCALLGLADGALAGPAPPFAELAALPEPSRLGAFPLALDDEIPTADPSWTKASRSGGRARTTPMANTAQAAARAGRSSPYRQSRGCRRAPPLPAPPLPAPPLPASSWPPRMAFQRRTRSARKPPRAEVPACLLA